MIPNVANAVRDKVEPNNRYNWEAPIWLENTLHVSQFMCFLGVASDIFSSTWEKIEVQSLLGL